MLVRIRAIKLAYQVRLWMVVSEAARISPPQRAGGGGKFLLGPDPPPHAD